MAGSSDHAQRLTCAAVADEQRLTYAAVSPDSAEFSQVEALYEEAFPPEERFPIGGLLDMARKPEAAFVAYYDEADGDGGGVVAGNGGRTLCGFTFHFVTRTFCYILFLAVNPDVRSHGYGSRILGQLREVYADRVHVLEIEPLDPAAPNYAQRVRRLSFYERNGFAQTGYELVEEEMAYTILCAGGAFDAQTFEEEVGAVIDGAFPMVIRSASS